MSIELLDTSNEDVVVDVGIVDDTPFTIAVWVNMIDVSGFQAIWCGSGSGSNHQHCLAVNGTDVEARSRGGSSFVTAVATGTVVVDTWHHIAASWETATLRNAYFDGGGKGSDTGDDSDPNALANYGFGSLTDSSRSSHMNGRVAHGAAWNAVLTDAEIAVLATGVSPLKVRPQSLVAYHPMHNFTSNPVDLIGGNDLDTASGTPTSSALAPAIFMPSAQILQFPPVAVGTSAALSGTSSDGLTEAELVTGGETIIITLNNDTWAPAGTGPIGSTADTQALIDGMDAADSQANGWNAEIRDKEVTTAVVRTSDTVATITLTASALYDITTNEVITLTINAATLVTSGIDVTATPTIGTIADVAGRIMGSLIGPSGLIGYGGGLLR